MSDYRRIWIPGGTYFFTLAIADRTQALLVEHIDTLRAAFAWTHRRHPFRTDAVVVLPDHLHAIWTLPEGDAEFALRWKLIKESFSRHLPRTETCSPSRRRKGERGIWQRRYWEHAIRDERDLAAHVDYVHINPVKHGHVRRASDWPYSSFHRFAREGKLTPDWAADANLVKTGE
jgi:putative transposase